ncbi:secreted protein [Niveomyces insectorum RCEF 264]|uniref:Secreted protein n=1 Tax=Niveomyces insectorum RCEF 264 TaxID=1081102 RepID=A0A167YU90_9HYPO|nr:secreted protein [Niveomyces insectorum RCEF 264]
MARQHGAQQDRQRHDGRLWPLLGGLVCSLLLAAPVAAATSSNSSACRLPADQNTYLSPGFDYKLDCAPSNGTLRGLMLFVDFPDQTAAADETPQSLHDFFLPAAAQWYATVSYGRLVLNVTADTSRFYRMPARADSYGWQRGLTSAAHQKYIQDALEAYSAANTVATAVAAPALPAVDVLYVVPTRRATAISFSTTYTNEVRTRGTPGTHVARKCVTVGMDAYSTWKFKVLNHETGHAMCLPDLYPLPSGPTGRYVGGWDIMGYINGPDPDYFAWHKWKLGWLDDDEVDCVVRDGGRGQGRGAGAHEASVSEHTLQPLEGGIIAGNGITRAVVVRHNATAVLVAEARTKRGADTAACATGVLLYTVSTVTDTGKGPIRVLDATPNSRGCAGEELNDAPLTLGGPGPSSFAVADWGINVTVMGQIGDVYTIRIVMS